MTFQLEERVSENGLLERWSSEWHGEHVQGTNLCGFSLCENEEPTTKMRSFLQEKEVFFFLIAHNSVVELIVMVYSGVKSTK